MGKTKRTPPPVIEQSEFLGIQKQLDVLKFNASDTRDSNDTKVFNLGLARVSPQGRFPIALVSGAGLATTGRREDAKRGINVIRYGNDRSFTKVALRFDRSSQEDLRRLCRGIIEKWKKAYDTTTRNKWYQDSFASLTDGTKVFTACEPINDPSMYAGMMLTDPDLFDSPGRTFGPFLYSDDEDASWYCDMGVDEGYAGGDRGPASDYRLYLYTEKGQLVGDKEEDGVPVYKKDGIPVKNHKMLGNLVDSKLYKNQRRVCNAMVQITRLTWKCCKDESGTLRLVPIFRMRVTESMAMIASEETGERSGITPEQRSSIINAIVFKNLAMPSGFGKRKRAKGGVAPTFNLKRSKTEVAQVPVDGSQTDDVADEIDTDGET